MARWPHLLGLRSFFAPLPTDFGITGITLTSEEERSKLNIHFAGLVKLQLVFSICQTMHKHHLLYLVKQRRKTACNHRQYNCYLNGKLKQHTVQLL